MTAFEVGLAVDRQLPNRGSSCSAKLWKEYTAIQMGEGEHEVKSKAGRDKWVLEDSWQPNGEHTQRTLFMSEDQEAYTCQEPKAGFCSGGGGGKHRAAVRKSSHSYWSLREALLVSIQLAWLFIQLLWHQCSHVNNKWIELGVSQDLSKQIPAYWAWKPAEEQHRKMATRKSMSFV